MRIATLLEKGCVTVSFLGVGNASKATLSFVTTQ
jgi:hypothetical protein